MSHRLFCLKWLVGGRVRQTHIPHSAGPQGLLGKNVAVLKVALMMGKLLLIPFGEANTFFGHARLVLVKSDVCCWSGFKLDPSGH